MNTKNNKSGITFVALIATVLVSLVLMSTVVISYSSFSTNTKKRAFANEISTIEAAIENYKFRNGKYPVKQEFELQKTRASSGLLEEFNSKGEIGASSVKLFMIDFEKLDIENLARGTSQNIDDLDMYAYSVETNTLYYLSGESIGNKVYYTYNDELYRLQKGIK